MTALQKGISIIWSPCHKGYQMYNSFNKIQIPFAITYRYSVSSSSYGIDFITMFPKYPIPANAK